MTSKTEILIIAEGHIGPDENDVPPVPGCEDCAEWHEHEHTAPAVQIQAEQLLNMAGSPELAKHAIDVVSQQPRTDS